MSLQNTIWVVDDTEEIIFCFASALAQQVDYRIVYVASATEVKAQPGDIVFLDLHGTNSAELAATEGVHVVRMTGSTKPAQLYKPFSDGDVLNVVRTISREHRRFAKKVA